MDLFPKSADGEVPIVPSRQKVWGSKFFWVAIILVILAVICFFSWTTLQSYFFRFFDSSLVVDTTELDPTTDLAERVKQFPQDILIGNAKTIMSQVDINNKSLVASGILFGYKGQITNITKDSDGLLSFSTEKSVPGLPNSWKFNKLAGTFLIPSEELGAVDDSKLRIGSRVLVTSAFIINTKNPEQISNQFNLIAVGILNDTADLTPDRDLYSNPLGETQTLALAKKAAKIKINDPKTDQAFKKAEQILSQVDLNGPTLRNAGPYYLYEGKITKIEKLNGQLFVTTDTKIQGLPNTWNSLEGIRTLVKKNGKFAKADESLLKVGDNVLINAFYVVNGIPGVEELNDFELSSITILQE